VSVFAPPEPSAGVTVARALGSPTRAEIYAYLREASEERTVRDVATRFELHPNVARTHLELLADAGLVRVGRRKHPGGGRPAKVYTALDQAAATGGDVVRERMPPPPDATLLVRLLAALLEAPGVDPSGRAVIASARRATLVGRGYETAVAEGGRLVAALGEDRRAWSRAASPEDAAAAAVRALRPYAPQVRVVRAGGDWVDIAGLRDVVAPLVGVRPDLADALERGLLVGALGAAGLPAALTDATSLPGGSPVWRARSAVQPGARAAADPATTLDTRGQARETGVLQAMRVVTRLSAGDVLEVLTEGPGSPAAFARWLDRAGHQLIAVERAADGAGRPAIRLLIRKAP
jgi:DNA-binding transcriptional ArsR family regulator/TusA-related sulfurtransferase